MNKKMKVAMLITLALALLASGAVLAASSGPQIGWDVIGGGGGQASSGAVVLMDTIGQPVIDSSSASHLQLNAGFWTLLAVQYGIYLPVITR